VTDAEAGAAARQFHEGCDLEVWHEAAALPAFAGTRAPRNQSEIRPDYAPSPAPGSGFGLGGPMNRGLESPKTLPTLSAAGRPIGPGAGVDGCPAHCPYPCCSTEDVAMRTCDFPLRRSTPGFDHPLFNNSQLATTRRPPARSRPPLAMHQPKPLG
jgi:hypothetical protein